MKKWKKYESYLLTGDWHIHTNYTDGKNTIFEYCKRAEELGLDLVAFTEHVRKNMSYNFNEFLSDVYSAKDHFDLVVLGGCETKVLDIEGRLDVSDEILKNCDVVLGAFHSFNYRGKYNYLTALCNMLQNTEVDIWAHPTHYAKINNIVLTERELYMILNLSLEHDVLIEKNQKYCHSINEKIIEIAVDVGCRFVYGSDSHELLELSNFVNE